MNKKRPFSASIARRLVAGSGGNAQELGISAAVICSLGRISFANGELTYKPKDNNGVNAVA